MQPHFYSASGALGVLQYATPTDHKARAVRIDIERYRRTLKSVLILVWGGVLIMAFFAKTPWAILIAIVSLAAVLALVLLSPYNWLEEEVVLQNRLCRGELRDTYVTERDPSYPAVVSPEGRVLYPLEQSRPFLEDARVIELDRELQKECNLTAQDIKEWFALRMELVGLAREAFGDAEHLDGMEQAAQHEKDELYGRARRVHQLKFGLMEHMSPEERRAFIAEGRRLSRQV